VPTRNTRSVKRAPPYSEMAGIYDSFYSWKDYATESRRIRQLIRANGPPRPMTLLDVGCGTGGHLVYLSREFESTGLDLSPEMLREARRKLPKVRFVKARMEEFDLAWKYDVVLCLFSAIASVRNESDLRRTLRQFARHLKPGGVAIVEPWFTRAQYQEGLTHVRVSGTEESPVARMSLSRRRGDRSIVEMHHLVGSPQGIRYWVERHDLGMFTVEMYLSAFRAAGFRARFLKNGLMKGRGLYVATLPRAPP
jgi:ubiquinone/menaquinone biosynthesis C-methylase UbiE